MLTILHIFHVQPGETLIVNNEGAERCELFASIHFVFSALKSSRLIKNYHSFFWAAQMKSHSIWIVLQMTRKFTFSLICNSDIVCILKRNALRVEIFVSIAIVNTPWYKKYKVITIKKLEWKKALARKRQPGGWIYSCAQQKWIKFAVDIGQWINQVLYELDRNWIWI